MAVLAIFVIIAYQVGSMDGKRSAVHEITSDNIEELCEIKDKNTRDGEPKLPACSMGGSGGCPHYELWNGQSIVYQGTTMTKGGAEIWIIKDDEVVYRTETQAMLDYKFSEDGSGITIRYVKEFDETSINPKTWAEQRLVYLEKTEKWVAENETESLDWENTSFH